MDIRGKNFLVCNRENPRYPRSIHHQMKHLYFCIIIMLFCVSTIWAAESRPAKWAIPLHEKGLPNLHRVSERLYRGGQPTAEGMKRLHEMGVKTIVDLRTFHSDRDEIGDTPLDYIHIRMFALLPNQGEIIEALRVITDVDRAPVFVHCLHGADRTGTVMAAYRIVVEGWTKKDALDEMVNGGFGYHAIFGNLKTFIHELNVEQIKKALQEKSPAN